MNTWCVRDLSVMQELGSVGQKCCQNPTEYPILGKEYPPPPHQPAPQE